MEDPCPGLESWCHDSCVTLGKGRSHMMEDLCPGLECCVTLAGESATFLLSSLACVSALANALAVLTFLNAKIY